MMKRDGEPFEVRDYLRVVQPKDEAPMMWDEEADANKGPHMLSVVMVSVAIVVVLTAILVLR